MLPYRKPQYMQALLGEWLSGDKMHHLPKKEVHVFYVGCPK